MDPVVCNIPHASKILPEWALEDITISAEELAELVDFMADKDIDKLWEFVPEQNKTLAKVSRIVVDTERFLNDADEPMAQKGMGMFYTHTPNGKRFRNKKEAAYQKAAELYAAYHNELEVKVDSCLAESGKCIILDCHSFHDEMNYMGYPPEAFPSVCIGINGPITPEAETVINAFKINGYSVEINRPFAGSLVPLKHLGNPKVVSVMIELNRRIYDNASFSKVQTVCREIYDKLKKQV